MKIKIASRKPLEEELLTEAVENIIPPSMSKIIEHIKEQEMPKAAQDVYAKYIAEHGLKDDGRGRLWNPDYVGKMFQDTFRIEAHHGGTHEDGEWISERKLITTAIKHLWLHTHPEEAQKESQKEIDDGNRRSFRLPNSDGNMIYFAAGPKYEKFAKPLMDSFNKIAQNWDDSMAGSGVRAEWSNKYNIELTGHPDAKRPRQGWSNPDGEAAKQYARYMEGSGAKAMLYMAQMYKSYLKSLKKWFKRNPEIAKGYVAGHSEGVEARALGSIQRKWDKGQGLWINQRIKSSQDFKQIRDFLNDEDDNYQEINAIFKNTHHRFEEKDDPQHEGWQMSTDSMEETLHHIKIVKLTKSYQICPDGWEAVLSHTRLGSEYRDGENPCALKAYDDGFFWFNRDAGVCSVAGEELANCGTANMRDSVLLILKQRIKKDMDDLYVWDTKSPIDAKKERIKYKVMLEYNPRKKEIIQVLGYENAMPDKEFWNHIKDAWQELGKPPISRLAWQHLERQNRVSPEQVKEFEVFIMGDREELEAPDKWFGEGGMVEKLKKGVYTDRTVDGRPAEEFSGTNLTGHEDMSIRFSWKGSAEQPWMPMGIGYWCKTAAFDRNKEIWNKEQDEYIRKRCDQYLDDAAKTVMSRFTAVTSGEKPPIVKVIQARVKNTHNPDPSRKTRRGQQIELRAHIAIDPAWFTEEEMRTDKPIPGDAHDIIMAFRNSLGTEQIASMLKKVIKWREDEYEHSQSPEGQWRPGMPTPGSEEEWADLTQGDPNAVADDEEFVAGHFGDDGAFTPDEEENTGLSDARVQQLIRQGDIMVRSTAASPQRVEREGFITLFRRWKAEFQQTGMWDDWVNALPDNHILRQSGLLNDEGYVDDNDEVIVEARNVVRQILGEKKSGGIRIRVNEGMSKQGVGLLPFRVVEGDVEFLIGEITNIFHAMPDEEPGENFKGKWTCFKGKIDKGEDAKTAARREFKEESTFSWEGELDDSMTVENNNVKVWLIDSGEFDPSRFDRNNVNKITGEYLNGEPEIWSIGWLSSGEAQNKLAKNQKDLIPQAMEKINKNPLEEAKKEITKLRVFDFDETIAFTTAATYVKDPNDKELEPFPDQKSFDDFLNQMGKSVEELEAVGWEFNFDEYITVNNPQLNKQVFGHIERILNKNKKDRIRAVYVMTARAPDSKSAIEEYLKELGFSVGPGKDFEEVITLSGSSKKDALIKLIDQYKTIKSVAFFDDSDRNIGDVIQLRDIYPEMDIQVNHVIEGEPTPMEEGREHLRLVPPEYGELEDLFPEWGWDYDGLTALVLADQWTDHLDQGMPPEDALKSLIHPLTGEQMYTEQNIYNMGGEIMMSVYDWVDSYKKGDLKENLLINIKRKK